MTLWQHVFTPFDTWWPNIEAAFIWGTPAGAVAIWRTVKTHRSHREIHQKLDALHAHLGIDQSGVSGQS